MFIMYIFLRYINMIEREQTMTRYGVLDNGTGVSSSGCGTLYSYPSLVIPNSDFYSQYWYKKL